MFHVKQWLKEEIQRRLRRMKYWPRIIRCKVFYLFHDEMKEMIMAADVVNPISTKSFVNRIKEMRWQEMVNRQIREVQKQIGGALTAGEKRYIIKWFKPDKEQHHG